MKIFDYRKHNGIFVTESHQWLAVDPDDSMECIFLMLSLKDGELLKDYYQSLPPENHEEHDHLKVAVNGFRFTDASVYQTGLAIQNGKGNPEGLLLPLKSFNKEFTFDKIYPSDNPNTISKYSLSYNERVYRFILMLDSLMIGLAEKSIKV
ncbi:hypothetical protein [Leptospira dzoumogneensis]|uniref:Uncharacterized protein n=1 Tax=Leptospira dzoumogneensis TaxID=2484904 RepID=A0A4Z1A9Z0_9LEPT|nr:hypothetical protein [Leptospira dzoumogneensis]TGM97297.1 hypothetical protein EHR06_14190 [Leptospira dzoumogneensis]